MHKSTYSGADVFKIAISTIRPCMLHLYLRGDPMRKETLYGVDTQRLGKN
jgi:hypothetical protein